MRVRLLVGLLLLGCIVSLAAAEEANWLDAGRQLAQAGKPAASAPAAKIETIQKQEAEGPSKKCPFSFSIDYTLISDYIFRGINLSEYQREGREKLNHQLNVGAEIDLGNYGTIGGYVWFEWFIAQQNLTPAYGRDIQEIDYAVYYRYVFEDPGLTAELGWLVYTLPPIGRDQHTDYELYLKVSYDDKKLFGTKENVLNPYAAYYQNIDLGACASWWEFGISHDFAMADCGLAGCPVMRHVTLTPSIVYGVQHRLFGEIDPTLGTKATSAVNVLFGLEIAYDLGAALGLPEEYGALTVSGLLFYSQALDHTLVNDEFFGGMKISYGW